VSENIQPHKIFVKIIDTTHKIMYHYLMDLNYIIRSELLRQNKKLSYLIEKLGCSRQALGVRMRRNDMKVSTLEQIADALDCDLEIKLTPRNQD